MAGTFLLEPTIMAMARTPEELRDQRPLKNEQDIDYRKIPRSSGDGMEHNGNSTEHKNHQKNSSQSNHVYMSPDRKKLIQTFVESQDKKENYLSTKSVVHKIENDHKHFQEVHERKDISLLVQDNRKELVSENEFVSNEKQAKLGTHSSQSGMSLAVAGLHIPDKDAFNTITNEYMEGISIDGDSMHVEQSYSEMKDIIKALEERNSKLIEEKTKLCVQLGLQTQVNSDIKKLLVAAVGDDLDNSLEALLVKNAQSAVEIQHWKKLSEEFAEESDKLAIECDVWRTKFMASRMMSDELSSWKTTLYTKYKQTQNALQRILSERAELKNRLIATKRLLHSLDYVVRCNRSSYKSAEILKETHTKPQQSVLELASIISCLVHDLAVEIQNSFDNSSIPAEALSLTEEVEKHSVEPTPAEKLAIQALSSDVELHPEEQQEESTVMKRMGKQYIGNSYQSRLMTNSFRVTYDCCDKCRGPIQVV